MLNLFIVLKGALCPKFSVPFKGISESSSKLSFVKACAKAPCRTLFGAIIGAGYKILSLLAEFRFSKLRLFNSKAIAEKFKSYNRAGNKLPALAKPLCAFSLVEMLMALLVASLLLAALAPVMTKKMNEHLDVTSTVIGENLQFCGYVNDSAGDIAYDLTDSKACKVPSDAHLASAIIAAGGGGGGGALGLKKGTTRLSEVIYGTAGGAKNGNEGKTKSFIITKDMTDIEIELLAAGGAGGKGATNQGGYPTNQNDCGNWGVYVDNTQNAQANTDGSIQHSVCVSKYNPANGGDGKATPKSNVSGVTNVNVGTSCSGGNCCWNGATSTTCQSSGNGFTYSGCNRTVCQWNAANTICQNWKPTGTTAGRLPTQAELAAWAPHIKNVSSTKSGVLNQPNGSFPGLQLCDLGSGYGALQCSPYYGGCPGSADNSCWPYGIWSSTQEGTDMYSNRELYSGSYEYTFIRSFTYAFGVRCVLDNISEFKSYKGGGGGAGVYIKVKIPEDTLQKAFSPDSNGNTVESLRLELIAGDGTNAEEYYKNYNSVNSGRSVGSGARLYKGNELIWYAGSPFSYSGLNAGRENNGYLADSRPADSPWCSYYNKYDINPEYRKTGENYFPCNEPVFTTKASIDVPADGVTKQISTGARAYWPTVPGSLTEDYPALAPAGGNANLNGSAGGVGSGGGGGACKEGSTRLSPECGVGGDGGGGAARFSYLRTIPGVGGGGGGSGSVLHIKNIQVTPNSTIAVGIGAGGRGGEPGADGTDGGTSYVMLGGTKYEAFGGKKGKAGTMGNPNSNPYVYSTPGLGGEYGGVSTAALPDDTKKYEYYPNTDSNKEIAKGKNAPDNGASANSYVPKAAGGDGGINVKTFLGKGTDNSRIPCGGFSTSTVKINNKSYKCEREDNYMPFLWRRMLNQDDFTSQDINFYPLGALGGGGGGWQRSMTASDMPSSGAAGLGGYVFIYFN